jgi:hypothetical protein
MARKPAIAPFKKSSPTLVGIGFKAGLTVFIGIGLLAGLVWLGQHAGQAVANQPKYQVPISGIQFDPPTGVDRTAFLAEVRSLGALPETISAVAAETPPLLASAFAKHPWVAEVKRVHIDADRTIHVELVYRTPVLAVKLTGEPTLRMVDKTGTLLPISPVPDLLTVLTGEMKSNDATVKRAAEIADMLKDKKPRKIEKTNTGWRVTPENGAVLNVAW